MKPIAIFRHACCEGAGYFGAFLNGQNIPWQEIRLDLGHAIPHDVTQFSGIVFMGGPMSVNDDLPWIPESIAFIQAAFAQDIPVMGHCLGGQLMSKALGASVQANPVKEIGWGKVNIHDNETAKYWFGNKKSFVSFHWHSETFDLPENAVPLLSSEHCHHQAFAKGKHLAMQCHIEMDAKMIETWCDIWRDHIQAPTVHPATQTYETIYHNIQHKLAALNAQAHYTYSQWIKGLVY